MRDWAQEEVFTPKYQYRAQRARYRWGTDGTCGEGVDNVWGCVFEVFEVMRGPEHEIGRRRLFSPPKANTERNALDIGGGPMELAERVLMTYGAVCLRCSR
jgi:hypothetical protein